MTDPWAAVTAPLRLSLDWGEDGLWFARAHFYAGVRTRPEFSRERTFHGLDTALGWLEAQAFEHGVTTGRALVYASALDDPSVAGRRQGRLWP